MENMFSHSVFNQDISDWNIESVTDTTDIFKVSEYRGSLYKWSVQKTNKGVLGYIPIGLLMSI
jgi:hypothetical protein